MSDSLKDQLMALGLANDGARKPVRGRKNLPRRRAGAEAEPSLEEAYRLREREERQARRRAKDRKREAQQQRRRLNVRIRAIVEPAGQNDPGAELKRSFLYKGRIRSVRVTRDQLAALNRGELAVVYLRGRYHLVAPEVAMQVRALSPEHVPDLGGGGDSDGEHPVPDDLVW